jgi:hypothetical protein
MREGLVETNSRARHQSAKQRRGARACASGGELAEVWRHAGDRTYGTILKLLILTGQRRTEIGSLR